MAMTSKEMTVSRGVFNVRQGGRPDGFPVIMLHGWPESSYCWEGVAEHMDPSLRLIAPDLRGLGDSERTLDPKAYRKYELAKDVVAIIDALEIDALFLVGHDWGGVVAQETAFQVPERVKRLVLMNIVVINNAKGKRDAMQVHYSQGAFFLWYQYFQQQPGLAEAMIKGNEDAWVRHFFGKQGIDGTIPAAVIDEYIRCYRIDNTPETGASYYRAMRTDAKRWSTLEEKRFPMPCLYIFGDRDPVIIPEYLNGIETAFDSIRVERIKASHFVQDERPREVAQLMNHFFMAGQQ